MTTTRRHIISGLAASTAALTLPWPARAQEASDAATEVPQEQGRIHIYVGAPGASKLPLALPRPIGGSAQAGEFYSVVHRDLDLSGWFDIIDEAAYIEAGGTGVRPGEFRFEDWDVPGAVALGKSLLRDQGGRIRAEAWVYDVAGRRKLGAKAFTADATALRSLAHKVANEIVFRVTGQNAPFATRFAISGTFSGNKEIYVVDFDGHGLTRITKNGTINLQPAWSPGGNKLAFTSYASGNPDCYVADLAGGRITRLSARNGINSGPCWSPDGTRLALTLAPNGDPDVYVLDSRTGEVMTRLTRSAGIDVSPSFSPDGRQIAFVSDRSGGAQVYVANVDGSDVRRVTFQGTHNTDPSWSPKGDRLAFVSRSSVFDVFTVRLDGTGLLRITQGMRDNEDPCWSPDGNYIACASTRTGSSHIWMSTADGTHQVQLTQGKGGYTNPSWSPVLGW
ncbi:MAG: Tol-Pal system beta propeller repeat protein TolB [Oligoflexia bacterium]|nr:Tol-Pal system beta propeller repeat protein TolB [Oligoflexia bacterium]